MTRTKPRFTTILRGPARRPRASILGGISLISLATGCPDDPPTMVDDDSTTGTPITDTLPDDTTSTTAVVDDTGTSSSSGTTAVVDDTTSGGPVW